MKRLYNLEGTKFIFRTNAQCSPNRGDKFPPSKGYVNIVVNDIDTAKELIDEGFKVGMTTPRENDDPETFVPEYFVKAFISFMNTAPNVFIVDDEGYQSDALTEDMMETIDKLADNRRIAKVNVTLSPYVNKDSGKKSIYVRNMYVFQDTDEDPWAKSFKRRNQSDETEDVEIPFN